ncbi:MAG: GTPase, partial [Spirochaetota bacterium]|nr:GTPase [Spirochaetota bacterium]
VSGVHGTTRDYIESWITISGIPVRLFDTAGLRDAEHPVEAEGIRRSARIIENAALVLYIVDGTAGLSEWDRQVLQEREIIPGGGDRNYLFVWNKIDLAAQPAPEGWLPLSAETGEGFSRLEKELSSRILGAASAEGEVMIDSRRQRELLVRAGGALRQAVQAAGDGMAMDFIAADLREALDALGEITGEVTSADILNQIFGDFCVGK